MAHKTGRRPAQESTAREDILRAAREMFGQAGFNATTLRAIAAKADVDVALIPYYFTNKRGLFVAALALPIDPVDRIRLVADGPRGELGRRIMQTFVGAWEDEATGPPLQGFFRSAATDRDVGQAFGGFITDEILPLVTAETGLSHDTAQVVISLLFGMVTMRYLVEIPAFAALSTDEVIERYAPRMQALIDAD
ncbi:TetR/AcrR family transcriptional regulator [Gordonia crocea]|uniref:TetR family transcriptional regulator n=1 Tax=Gordonia crocea TaxID=589162 RepID=A0A7M3SV31_9ACTN|nr:TetR family transcriptional regulator [Gordonia crocea]GED96505.1 TetR family transcriptional regulator [Gordonia crocea]